MIGAMADGDTTSSVGDIFEPEVESLTWSQSPMKHEEKHRLVPLETQRFNQRGDLLIRHRTRHPLNGFDMHGSPNWALPGSSAHERAMAIRDARVGRIIHFHHGIFRVRKLIGNNQVLVEGRNSGKDAIDGSR